jgi:hypothetical protein
MIAARIRHPFAPLVLIAALSVTPLKATTTPSKVVSREIQSINFTQSKIGVSPTRRMVVYLPAGYDESQKRYPTVASTTRSCRSSRSIWSSTWVPPPTAIKPAPCRQFAW